MNPKLPLQRKLFEGLSTKFKNKKTEIEYYSKKFGLTRSVIYDRRKGKTPIGFDDGVELMLAHDLSTTILPNPFLIEAQKSILFPSSIELAPVEYLSYLAHDIALLAKSPQPYLWHKTNDLPVFWLKQSRILAAFKIYFWIKVLSWTKKIDIPVFSVQWSQTPQIAKMLDQGRDILHAYQTIPGTEIWTRGMFDATIAQIDSVIQTGGITDPELINHLSDEMKRVIHLMRKMAQNGNKHPEGGKAELLIFDNGIFPGGNLLIGVSEAGGFSYVDVGYPDFIRHNQNSLITYQVERFQSMLPQMELVSSKERSVFDFFSSLEKHLELQLKQLNR